MRARKLTDDRPRRGFGLPRAVQLSVVAVTVIAGVFALLGLLTLNGGRSSVPGQTSESSPSSQPSSAVSGSASEVGSDSAETADLTGLAETCRQFVSGWLIPSGADRRAILEPVTVPGLMAQLMSTDPAKVPKWKPVGACQVEQQSAYTVMVSQPFDQTEISLLMVVDPEAQFGWRVTSIGQV